MGDIIGYKNLYTNYSIKYWPYKCKYDHGKQAFIIGDTNQGWKVSVYMDGYCCGYYCVLVHRAEMSFYPMFKVETINSIVQW